MLYKEIQPMLAGKLAIIFLEDSHDNYTELMTDAPEPGSPIASVRLYDTPGSFVDGWERMSDQPDSMWYWCVDFRVSDGTIFCSGACDPDDWKCFAEYFGSDLRTHRWNRSSPWPAKAVHGPIRRVDDLGRIAIPREVRRELLIRDGAPLEVIAANNCVVMRKWSSAESAKDALTAALDLMRDETELDEDARKCILGLLNQAIKEAEKAMRERG